MKTKKRFARLILLGAWAMTFASVHAATINVALTIVNPHLRQAIQANTDTSAGGA
jgi:hypothetical protein